MTSPYFGSYMNKTVQSVAADARYEKVTIVRFTDGTKMSIHPESRSFFTNEGAEFNMNDFDARVYDGYFTGGVIRTPKPPRFPRVQDPVLRTIVTEFETMQHKLMQLCGRNRPSETYAAEWKAATDRFERTVRSFHGYMRVVNILIQQQPPQRGFWQRLRERFA